MLSNLTIRIENTAPTKSLLPWVTVARKGRQSVTTQCFALLGYSKKELDKLTPPQREEARDILEFAVRSFSAFEYIPDNPEEIESFFEKKLINFENRLQSLLHQTIPLQAVVGITQGNLMLFAISGDVSIIQITPSRIINLTSSNSGMVRGAGALHFDSFQSGILSQRSCVLIVPRIMAALFKSDEIKNLALAGSSDRKLNYLEGVWQNRNTESEPFRAILLEVKTKNAKPTETTAISIAQLINTENKTEELLSPPLLKPILYNIKSTGLKIARVLNKIAEIYKTQKPHIKPKPFPKPGIKYTPILTSKLHGLVSKLRAKLSFQHGVQAISSKLTSLTNDVGLIKWFNILPIKSKVLVFLIFTFLFVFAQSVLLTTRHSKITDVETKLKEEISAINHIIDEANTSLIYNDEEKTSQQFAEAQKRIQALPEFQKTIAKDAGLSTLRPLKFFATNALIDELNKQLFLVQEKMRHIVNIDTPTPADTKIISALNLKDQLHVTALYNKRLYELRPAENQVFKREPIPEGFTPGTPWIKDNTDVRKSVSIAVDGSVYLLEDTGKVVEFTKGYKTNFAVKDIDPTLSVEHENTTLSVERENTQCCQLKIWTNENSNYLYILDAGANRLVVFDKKTGFAKAQYTSPTFTSLKDFSIDEKTKTAFLLDGVNVVSILLSHL